MPCDEVAFRVEHLNLVGIDAVEHLAGHVGGIDDEFERGMPCGIDTCREDGVVAHVDFLDVTIIGDDRSAHALTGVKLHPFGVVLLVVVAVDALSVAPIRAEHVVVYHALVVVFQTALVDGQVLIGDIRRRNQSITDIGVDGVGVERLEAPPTAVLLHIHLYLDGIALGTLGEPFPVIGIGHNLPSAADDLFLAGREPRHHIVGMTVDLEGQRRNVDGNRDVGIVRIDVGEFVGLPEILGYVVSTSHQQCCHGGEQKQSLHVNSR